MAQTIKERFENATLPDFLEKVMKNIDKLSDIEKKVIVKTIIAKIEINRTDKETIKIFLNAAPVTICNGGANVQPRQEWWVKQDLNL